MGRMEKSDMPRIIAKRDGSNWYPGKQFCGNEVNFRLIALPEPVIASHLEEIHATYPESQFKYGENRAI